jgi:hypothetical protein
MDMAQQSVQSRLDHKKYGVSLELIISSTPNLTVEDQRRVFRVHSILLLDPFLKLRAASFLGVLVSRHVRAY